MTKRNKYLLYETHGELWFLEKDERTVKAVMLFDLEDLEFLQDRSWHINCGYAVSNVSDKKVRLHRLIMCAPESLWVDHINGNRLDNRRSNLRVVTTVENAQNVTKTNKNKKSNLPLGVFYNNGSYKAEFCVDKRRYNKTFKTAEEASEWYCSEKARVLEDSSLNVTLGYMGDPGLEPGLDGLSVHCFTN